MPQASNNNPARRAIDEALRSKRILKKELTTEITKELGVSKRMFHYHQERGVFPDELAFWLSRRLGIAASVLRGENTELTGVDPEVVVQCYALFRKALAERAIEMPLDREARAYKAFLLQSLNTGAADASMLDMWLDATG